MEAMTQHTHVGKMMDTVRSLMIGPGGMLTNNKIALIKELRGFSGMGLKDSKDAVELAFTKPNPVDAMIETFLNANKLVEEDAKRLREEAEKLAEQRKKDVQDALKAKLSRAVSAAVESWEALGFTSAYHLAGIAIKNLDPSAESDFR